MKRIKLAIGLSSTCSGCDIAILDLGEKILNLASLADIVFWPTAMDFKLKDLEKMKSKKIDITLFHGTTRTSHHEERCSFSIIELVQQVRFSGILKQVITK